MSSHQLIQLGSPSTQVRFRGKAPITADVKKANFNADTVLMELLQSRPRPEIKSATKEDGFIAFYCTEKHPIERIIHYGMVMQAHGKITVFDNGYGVAEVVKVSQVGSEVPKEDKKLRGAALITTPPDDYLAKKVKDWYLVDINFLEDDEVQKVIDFFSSRTFFFSFVRNCRKTASCLVYSLCLKYPTLNFINAVEWILWDSYDQFWQDVAWKRLRFALEEAHQRKKAHVYQDVFNDLVSNRVVVYIKPGAERILIDVTVKNCRNLYNADASKVKKWDKSDSFVKVYYAEKKDAWEELGRTGTKKDDLNPNWDTKNTFFVDSTLPEIEGLRFVVWDEDTVSSNDYLGTAVLTKEQVVCRENEEVSHAINLFHESKYKTKWKPQGTITVTTKYTKCS